MGCGYRGSLIIEDGELAAEIRKKAQKSTQEK
jgi:hypothetical protein